MSKPIRFVSAASTIVLASMLAGCAAPQVKTSFGGRTDDDTGLATRAMIALNSNDFPAAIGFAERAVEKTPDDAGFRAILGNAYFAAGRFWSAESAYKDSLTIYSNQPQVVLKLALVEVALGKKDEAASFLQAGRQVLDASNYGLALALAGRADEAIPVLDAAARKPGADATARQNLALAHALAGDWAEARTIAAQDVPADKLDARMDQWMQLASPKKPADQIAALVGVTPAEVDHGQPVRLALRNTDTMMAQVSPVAHSPVLDIAPAPQPQVAEVVPAAPEPKFVEAVSAPAAPEATPAVAPAPEAPKLEARPVIAEAPAPSPVAMIAAAAHEVTEVVADKASALVEAVMARTAQPAVQHPKRRAAARQPVGPGDTVMQIASYRTPEQVTAGWATLTQRYPSLRGYLPLKARFDSPNGTYWRLSIQGFASQREAISRCNELRSNGGKCFVRGFAGDAPIQMASR
jgi:Flp pilus assembly protein TadD